MKKNPIASSCYATHGTADSRALLEENKNYYCTKEATNKT
jgi:hypothetical protein